MALKEKTYHQVNCIIDGRETKTKLLSKTGLFGWPTYVSICKECGLVFLTPRWTKEDYDHFYTKEYESHFWFDKEAADEKEKRRIKDVWHRLQKHLISTPTAALDVGCGLGWSLDYFAKKVEGIEIAGVEPSDYCAEHVTNVIGAELVGRDVDAEWHIEQAGRFDIVVMRMVAEHLLDPIGAFKKVRETLSSSGLFYIAIPNMMNPAGSLKKFWYRIVHTYYYSKTTLTRIAGLAGMEPLIVEEEGAELWGIFKRKENFEDPNLPSVYSAQMQVLRAYKTKRFVRGIFQIFGIRKLGKLVPKTIKNWIPEGVKKKFRKAFYGH